MIIRLAHAGEGERLREIAAASKAHWGYDADFVRAWASSGDFSDDALERDEFFVAESDERAVAWAALKRKDDALYWLDDLWVEPEWIGRGIGTALFRRVVGRARELGARRLEWQAEPNSVGFYEKVGARCTGELHMTSWGREVPVMELEL